ncbi:MAG: hypothetical protein H0W72_13655, partial [Planctomycetes bacterium]|nr:hypothetical protein [Planctomycetota bacterium]
PALWRAFVALRHDLLPKGGPAPCLPFAAAFAIQRAKYAQSNWVEREGYYSVGLRENRHQDWQPGWVGGLMSTLPLLRDGTATERAQALRTFDFLFPKGLGASGLCYGTWHQGAYGGDGFDYPHAARWTLTRKSADVLIFALKQFTILEQLSPGMRIPTAWSDGVRRIADAFVRLWREHRQFAQFVDVESGAITVGGSTSAAIAIGGLAMAWKRFGVAAYREVAEQAAAAFAERYLATGWTTGGPGEILQCPDSESAFGLLEGYVVLAESTGDARWLEHARAAADQCASWITSYDYPFPAASTFGKLGMRSTGSVWANVQNKHSAPAICTLSGDSLLKLFRATGEVAYLDLLVEIARGVTQYLSRADRPIAGMPAGFMNERVNLSDWLEPVGEIFSGSCWCEVSCLLTWSEVPGVYVQSDTGLLRVLDHVEAELCDGGGTLRLRNPTAFATEVTVLCETAADARNRWLGPVPLSGCRRIPLAAGAIAEVQLFSASRAPAGSKPSARSAG